MARPRSPGARHIPATTTVVVITERSARCGAGGRTESGTWQAERMSPRSGFDSRPPQRAERAGGRRRVYDASRADCSLPATTDQSGAPTAPPESTPDEQDDDRPDHGDHDALDVDPGDVTLVEHHLGKVPAHDRSDDAKDDRPDQPLAATDDHVRQKPRDGTEHDPTDDAHRVPPSCLRPGLSLVRASCWVTVARGAVSCKRRTLCARAFVSERPSAPAEASRGGRVAHMLFIGSIVLRVDDLGRQTEFWSAALDYVPHAERGDDFLVLRPRNGIGPNLSLALHHSSGVLQPRLHLDLYTEDQVGEVQRLLALGAIEVHWDLSLIHISE